MLGWNVSVYRQADGGTSPAVYKSAVSGRIAVWQTGDGGLSWLFDLAKVGNATDLGGDGYPYCFTAQAEHIIPRILDKPPNANDVWRRDVHDTVLDGWVGKTAVDREVAKQCRFDEWLLIIAWDES